MINLSLNVDGIHVDARIDTIQNATEISRSSYSAHMHTAYEVYFIEKGTLKLLCSQQQILLKSQDILIIPPNTLHHVEEGSHDLKRFNVRILFPFHPKNLFQESFLLYQPNTSIREEMDQILSALHAHMSMDPTHTVQSRYNTEQIKAYLTILISYILEHLLPDDTNTRTVFPQSQPIGLSQCIQIETFFDRRHSEKVTIQDLAQELHYSKTHINRILKKYWGLTFSEKLMQTRLQAAQQLLEESSLSIEEIAFRCGYTSVRGFELFFFRHTHLLPTQYRISHRPFS